VQRLNIAETASAGTPARITQPCLSDGSSGREAAPEPGQRGVPWQKLIAALVVQGAIFRAVRGRLARAVQPRHRHVAWQVATRTY
jgi:hypothetical protein